MLVAFIIIAGFKPSANAIPCYVAGIYGPTSVCVGDSIILTDSTTGGTWYASNSNATVSGGHVVGVRAGLDTIRYMVVTSCGPVFVNTVINVTPAFIPPSIAGSHAMCTGSSLTLTPSAYVGTWSTTGHITSISTGGVVSASGVGRDTIFYTTSSTCSNGIVKHIMTVEAPPTGTTISGSTGVCLSGMTTLIPSDYGGTWRTTSGGTIASISSSGDVSGISLGTDTVIYTIVTLCGSDSARRPITVISGPSAASITGAEAICERTSTTLVPSITGGTWSISGTYVATISAYGHVYGVHAGIDTITYTLSNSCGTVSTVFVDTVLAQPVSGTLSGPSSVCEGSFITLTTTVSGGVWSASNATASVLGGDVTGATAGLDTIYYTVTNRCGSAVVSKEITVNPLPHAGYITGSSVICMHSSTTLTPSVTGGTWMTTDSSVATVSRYGIATSDTAGVVLIKYWVRNVCGTDTAFFNLTVLGTPNPGTLSGASTVCPGSTIYIAPTVGGGTWRSTNNTIATVSSGFVRGIRRGTDTIWYIVDNGCGVDSVAKVIDVLVSPVAGVITGPTSICQGLTVTLTDTTSGGTWSSSNTLLATVAGGVVHTIGSGTVTISYSYTNSCGTAVATFRLTILPAPNAGVILGATSVCQFANAILTESVTGGVWGIADTFYAGQFDSMITGREVGIAHVFYAVRNSCGFDTAWRDITVNPAPDAGTIVGDSIGCLGFTRSLTSTTLGGRWYSRRPTIATVGLSTGIVTCNATGLDTLLYVYTNSCGSDTNFYRFWVQTSPGAGVITGPDSMCPGDSATLRETVTGGVWATNLPTVATINPTTGKLHALGFGYDTITYWVSNACGVAHATHPIYIKTIAVCNHVDVPEITGTEADFTLTPNPNSGTFSINLLTEQHTEGTVTIINMLGEKVYETTISTNDSHQVQLDIPRGIYVITATVEDKRYSKRFVIE